MNIVRSGSWKTFRVALLLSFGACSPDAGMERQEAVFRKYVDAVNRGAVSEALAVHSTNPEFVIPGQNPIRGMRAMEALLQWDSVLGSTIRFDPLEWRADTLVVGDGSERNAWFAGIGLDSVRYKPGTRFVFEGDRISGVYPSSFTSESLRAFQERYGAFMEWAEEDAPEVVELAPGGLFNYHADAASAWLRVFERYRSER